jgi:hypothetical protein
LIILTIEAAIAQYILQTVVYKVQGYYEEGCYRKREPLRENEKGSLATGSAFQ